MTILINENINSVPITVISQSKMPTGHTHDLRFVWKKDIINVTLKLMKIKLENPINLKLHKK